MRFSDSVVGIFLLVLGATAVLMARTFPAMPGQSIGPALFPTLMGCGLLLSGCVLAFTGLREAPTRWVVVDPDLRRPRMALNLLVLVLSLVGYALIVDKLGFFLTAASLLALLLWTFGVGVRLTATLAVVVPIVLHYGFYSILRVPLPWGVLEGVAW